jgi:hypothetical protein
MRVISAAILAVLTTATAAHADRTKHDEQFCTSLASLKGDLQELRAMRDDSKASELRDVIDRIDRDSREVEKAGSKIKTPAGKQFMASAERLKVEGRAVSDDMTIGQLRTRMREDVGKLETSTRQLANEAGCAEATPEPEGRTGGTPHTY